MNGENNWLALEFKTWGNYSTKHGENHLDSSSASSVLRNQPSSGKPGYIPKEDSFTLVSLPSHEMGPK